MNRLIKKNDPMTLATIQNTQSPTPQSQPQTSLEFPALAP